jgi:hypothetical protein
LQVFERIAGKTAADVTARDQLTPLQQGAYVAGGVANFRVDVRFLAHSVAPFELAEVQAG